MNDNVRLLRVSYPFWVFSLSVLALAARAEIKPLSGCDALDSIDKNNLQSLLIYSEDSDAMFAINFPWKNPVAGPQCLLDLATGCNHPNNAVAQAACTPNGGLRLGQRMLVDGGSCQLTANMDSIIKTRPSDEDRLCWCLLGVSAGGPAQCLIERQKLIISQLSITNLPPHPSEQSCSAQLLDYYFAPEFMPIVPILQKIKSHKKTLLYEVIKLIIAVHRKDRAALARLIARGDGHILNKSMAWHLKLFPQLNVMKIARAAGATRGRLKSIAEMLPGLAKNVDIYTVGSLPQYKKCPEIRR